MRKALIVGINEYPGGARLKGCVDDATKVAELLDANADGSPNFDVMLSTNVKTKETLKSLIHNVFKNDDEVSLFYFFRPRLYNRYGRLYHNARFQSS